MATGDITFALRSNSVDAYRSLNGKTGNKLAGTEVVGSDAGAIGGESIDLDTNNAALGSRHALIFNGGANVPTTQGLSILFRAKYTGDSITLNSMFDIGLMGTETFHKCGAYVHHGSNIIGYNSSNDSFITRVNSSVAWTVDEDWHDFVITDDGQANADSVKIYLDGTLLGSLSASDTMPSPRNNRLDDHISIGYAAGLTVLTSEWYLNEFVIFEGVIDPTNVTLEDPDTGATSSGSLNGASRTDWVHCTAFDALDSTDPGEANVRDGQAYKIDGVAKEGTYEIDFPDVEDVREGVEFDSGNLTGTLDLPSTGDVKLGVEFDNGSQVGTLPYFTADSVSGKYTIEQFASELEAFMKTYLNPQIEQSNTDLSAPDLDAIDSEAYHFMTMQENMPVYNPFIFYGEVGLETVNNGPVSLKLYTFQVAIILQFTGETNGYMGKRLLRYRDILEELFRVGWNTVNKRVKLDVTSLAPFPFSLNNEGITHMGVGVNIEVEIP